MDAEPDRRRASQTFSSVLRRWESLVQISDDLGLPESTVRSWVSRDYIPALYFPALIESAKELGVPGVSMRALRELEAGRSSARAAIARTNRQHSGRRLRASDYV